MRTLVIVFISLVLFGAATGDWHHEDAKAAKPSVDELLTWCSPFESLDKVRMITFIVGSHSADLREATTDEIATGALFAKHPRLSSGRWTADEANMTVAVDIGGAETQYTLVVPADGDTCILVSGAIDSANLTKSWFGTMDLSDG